MQPSREKGFTTLVQVIEVISVEIARGSGKDETDPIRSVVQYWSKAGMLLAENDEHKSA